LSTTTEESSSILPEDLNSGVDPSPETGVDVEFISPNSTEVESNSFLEEENSEAKEILGKEERKKKRRQERRNALLAHAALAREDWAALTNSSALTMGMMREIMAHQIAVNEHLAEVRAESTRTKQAENKTLGLTSVYTFLAIFGSAMAGKGVDIIIEVFIKPCYLPLVLCIGILIVVIMVAIWHCCTKPTKKVYLPLSMIID